MKKGIEKNCIFIFKLIKRHEICTWAIEKSEKKKKGFWVKVREREREKKVKTHWVGEDGKGELTQRVEKLDIIDWWRKGMG
jgi:hypothetical protein